MVQQIGLLEGQQIGGSHHHILRRKEHVPAWKVEKMGMMRWEVGGGKCEVRGARCSKMGLLASPSAAHEAAAAGYCRRGQ